ncbi:hypothetical protein G5I_03562 [Acromyrmex echinatior]|uniref:Uncharacterized protein n=1 Tax=Acromyrmex echinatior TaxID=103372 RepID=F4WDA9_ACREC|nr:hypothetical protein G5I_03562 [Acromyrmex echinatior]
MEIERDVESRPPDVKICPKKNRASLCIFFFSLEHDSLIAVLGSARNKRCLDFFFVPMNCMMFAVAAEYYKIADTLVYRETMQHVLDYKSECAIRPRISAIFGLNHINDAFNYYAKVPSGKVLIDLKDHDRLILYDES